MSTANVSMNLTFVEGNSEKTRTVTIKKAVVGGWTGRDKASLQHHIDELAELGVEPPQKTPMFYRVGVSRLSSADAIEVIGSASSGEAEYVMLQDAGKLWIGAGSDHTDREFERFGITLAKQLCDKPIATRFWAYDDVAAHWDRLLLRSSVFENGERVTYQDGGVTSMLSPRELLDQYAAEGNSLDDGTLMFGGTIGAIGGVRFSNRFEFELEDPVLGRTIRHAYEVATVPILG